MSAREAVERLLAEEEAALVAVVDLLAGGAPLETWPAPLRSALALALFESPLHGGEVWKATALRRHLFGPAPDSALRPHLQPPAEPTSGDRRRGERLRADLARLTRLRAGVGLIDAT